MKLRRIDVLPAALTLSALMLWTGCGSGGGEPPGSEGSQRDRTNQAPDWSKYTNPSPKAQPPEEPPPQDANATSADENDETKRPPNLAGADEPPIAGAEEPRRGAPEQPPLGESEEPRVTAATSLPAGEAEEPPVLAPKESAVAIPQPEAATPAGPPTPRIVERVVRNLPPPDDLMSDAELRWVTDFGPGGMFVPQLPEPPPEEREGLTKVLAAVFPQGARDVLFVGLREPDLPPIATADLLDAFILAYRAAEGGPPPGVSIDPRPEQLQVGLREGDLMDVVYFGGVEQSEYGLAAFEADRLMKCLSAGKDNITRQPFVCRVPGYFSELQLLALGGGGRDGAWHRFWIEYESSNVAHGADGRSLMSAVKLGVRTQYMEAENGKLVSGNRPPDPVAKQFSSHLTEKYALYARAFHVFNRLEAFAAVTSIAAAIREDEQSGLRREIEEEWRLQEHALRTCPTPVETPAVVSSAATPGGVAQLTGGVTLAPANQHHRPHPRTDSLAQAVLDSLPAHVGQRQWTIPWERKQYTIARARPQRSQRTWQEDLRVGSLRLVREYGPRNAQGEATPGWFFQAPHVRLSQEIADYKDAGRAAKAAYVYDEEGRSVTLSKFGQLIMPGNAAAPGYGNADDTRSLYLYANGWMYLEGDVQFVSINGGPPTAEIGAGGSVIQFSPHKAENHRVQWAQTAEGNTTYEYEGERLASIGNDRGEIIRLIYDGSGRVTQAVGSDGQTVSYFYDQRSRLKQLANNQGARLSYLYGEMSDAPIGVRAELRENPAADRQPTVQAVVQTPEPIPPSASLLDPRTRYLMVQPSADGQGGYEMTVAANGLSLPNRWRIATDFSPEMIESLAAEMAAGPGFLGADTLVIVGDWDVSNSLAASLRKSGFPTYSATSVQRAEQNLHSPPPAAEARFVIHKESLKPSIAQRMPQPTQPPGAGIVFLVGHYRPDFVAMLHAEGQAGAFRGMNVVQLTCRTEETPGDVENILGAYGAVSVTGFNQPIPQHALPSLVKAIQEKMNYSSAADSPPDSMRKHQAMERLIREAVEAIQRNPRRYNLPPSVTPAELENLKVPYERVGRLLKIRSRAIDPADCWRQVV